MSDKKASEKENKPKKKAGFTFPIILVILCVLVVGGALFLMNSSNIAKAAIEKIATNTLGVPVSIASLDLSLQEKTVSVSGIKVGNPKGFSKPNALTVDQVNIVLESFQSGLIIFDEIRVAGTNLNLEVSENGTNFSEIKKNIKPKASKETSPDKPETKVIIDSFLMQKAALNPTITLAGGDLATVTMPDIKLTGIGRKSNGVLASEALSQIFSRVSKVAVQQASQSGFLQGMSTEGLKELQNSYGISGSLMDKAKEDIKSLGDGIKGLFGN
jgi:hypothetical protein